MKASKKAMPTIWRVSDELWAKVEAVLVEKDAPKSTGRKRVDARLVLDTLIYRLRSGCQWNQLPSDLADDSSAHRTLQRWEKAGVFAAIWADLVSECDELGGVDWEWQAADGATSKSRFGGSHRTQPHRPWQSGRETQPAGGGRRRTARDNRGGGQSARYQVA